MEYSAVVDDTLRSTAGCAPTATTTSAPSSSPTSTAPEDDLESLLPLAPNLRLVKGAYLEPADSPTREADVDAAYVRLLERMLAGGGYTAIATHDERLIEHAIAFAEARGHRPRPLRVPDALRRPAAAPARPRRPRVQVLVATPFGPEWFPYLMRRLAERPANLGFFLKSAVRR